MNASALIIPLLILAAIHPSRHYHDSVKHLCDTAVAFTPPSATDSHIQAQAIEARASLPQASIGCPLQYFGVFWDVDSASGSRTIATLRPINPMPHDEMMEHRAVEISIRRIGHGIDSLIFRKNYSDGFGLEHHPNTLGVEIDLTSRAALVYGGDKKPREIAIVPLYSSIPSPLGVMCGGPAEFSLVVTEEVTDIQAPLIPEWSEEAIKSHLKTSSHAPEGLYRLLDRENYEQLSRLGGDYTLALISDGAGGYYIFYMDGAQVGKSSWKPSMVKGILKPTIFTDHYNLMWYDSSHQMHSTECNAEISQRAILSLNFPRLKTRLRFSRVTPR